MTEFALEAQSVNELEPAAPTPMQMIANAIEKGLDPALLEKMMDLQALLYHAMPHQHTHLQAVARHQFPPACPDFLQNRNPTQSQQVL